ncbi:MAG: glycosyltransferase family 4 protein [Gemmatales bacterium]|nr:glycosyltransferase family 4 protein [Gemmatales bacterium]MDW8221398.1 glycosyltransferase family 4 protein [Gemmatales bacterium]
MRFLIVSHYVLPHIGGVEQLVDLETRALAEAGHEVTVVASDGLGAGEMPKYPPTVRVILVPAWHELERTWQVPYPLFSPHLVHVLAQAVRWADIVHVHGFLFQGTLVALWWARRLNKPSILTDHGGIQHFASATKRFLAWTAAHTLGRLSCRWADQLVAYNARVLALLEQLSGKSARFVANPIRRERFRPPTPQERAAARCQLGWTDSRPRILFVGRLVPEKGVAQLLQLRREDWEIVLCGPGAEAWGDVLRKPGITYLPPRPQAELIPLYHASDVLVLPSAVREGFPLVVQEALACGLPAVLGDDPGFAPYRTWPGLYLTSPEPPALAQKVDEVLRVGSSVQHPDYATALDRFCPDPQLWLRQLYSDFLPVR